MSQVLDREAPELPLPHIPALARSQGQWNAYVIMGTDRADRAARLAQVPEPLREAVADNTRTYFAARKHTMNKQRGVVDVLFVLVPLAVLGLWSFFRVCPAPEPVELPLPPPLILPTIQATELACLSEPTYITLTARDTACRERVKTLEGIIRSTHTR